MPRAAHTKFRLWPKKTLALSSAAGILVREISKISCETWALCSTVAGTKGLSCGNELLTHDFQSFTLADAGRGRKKDDGLSSLHFELKKEK
jgi:hypothetical protein